MAVNQSRPRRILDSKLLGYQLESRTILVCRAWFCVTDPSFTWFSAVIGPKLDPSFSIDPLFQKVNEFYKKGCQERSFRLDA
jgi:hypothetical protein